MLNVTELRNGAVFRESGNLLQVITYEHVKNNQDVRALLGKSGIKPENLPPEEDIKRLERRVKSSDKKLLSNTKKLGNITKNKGKGI